MLTSFQFCIFLEIHRDRGFCYLSYSPTVLQDNNTEIVRALLGLVLISSGRQPYDPMPDVGGVVDQMWKAYHSGPGAGPSIGPTTAQNRTPSAGTTSVAGRTDASDGIGEYNSQSFLQAEGNVESDILADSFDPGLTGSSVTVGGNTQLHETQGSKGTIVVTVGSPVAIYETILISRDYWRPRTISYQSMRGIRVDPRSPVSFFPDVRCNS